MKHAERSELSLPALFLY